MGKNAMLHRFIFVNFSEGPLATNRESPKGEGRGTRALPPSTFRPSSCGHPPRVDVSFLGLSEKHFPRTPPGKEKVRFLRSALLPLAASGQRRESRFALG